MLGLSLGLKAKIFGLGLEALPPKASSLGLELET